MSSIEARLERLERLINKPGVYPDVSLIYPSGGGWALNFGTWDGRPGNGKTVTTYYDTEGEAQDAYNKLLEQYPEKWEPTLIILGERLDHENR